jgi:hypothetical protein
MKESSAATGFSNGVSGAICFLGMPVCRRVIGIVAAIVAAGCTIDRAGNAEGDGAAVQRDAGGMDAGVDATLDAGMVGVDVGPDSPPDTGRVIPCAAPCDIDNGETCNTATGTCVCSGPSWCCSGCPSPGTACNLTTHTCVCNGTCLCNPSACPAPMVCGPAGKCMPPPPPPCGGEDEECCAGSMCDDTSHICSPASGRCRHCGRAAEFCCAGRSCDTLLTCRGPDLGYCGI